MVILKVMWILPATLLTAEMAPLSDSIYIKSIAGIPNASNACIGSSANILLFALQGWCRGTNLNVGNNLFYQTPDSKIWEISFIIVMHTLMEEVKPVGPETIFNEANSGFTDFANGVVSLATNSADLVDKGHPDVTQWIRMVPVMTSGCLAGTTFS